MAFQDGIKAGNASFGIGRRRRSGEQAAVDIEFGPVYSGRFIRGQHEGECGDLVRIAEVGPITAASAMP